MWLCGKDVMYPGLGRTMLTFVVSKLLMKITMTRSIIIMTMAATMNDLLVYEHNSVFKP